MNYNKSVVHDYLRADRAVFFNAEYCIQVNPGNPDTSGPHWYCNAVALDFRAKEILLCEISYAAGLADLAKKLKGWHDNWKGVCEAVARDSFLSEPWPVRPWLFVPDKYIPLLKTKLTKIVNGQPALFNPKITALETVQPWLYRSWNQEPY